MRNWPVKLVRTSSAVRVRTKVFQPQVQCCLIPCFPNRRLKRVIMDQQKKKTLSHSKIRFVPCTAERGQSLVPSLSMVGSIPKVGSTPEVDPWGIMTHCSEALTTAYTTGPCVSKILTVLSGGWYGKVCYWKVIWTFLKTGGIPNL